MRIDYDEVTVAAGLDFLMNICGEAAKASGWHGDRPTNTEHGQNSAALRNWQGMKIMLMVSELAEAVEELRKGKTADETYYIHRASGQVLRGPNTGILKPEGVPSELADTIIRIMDFCYTEGIDIGSMVMEKLAFNATRGHKHGKVV